MQYPYFHQKAVICSILILATGCSQEGADSPNSEILVGLNSKPGLLLQVSNDPVVSAGIKPGDPQQVIRVNLHIKQVELRFNRDGGVDKTATLNLYQNQAVNLIELTQNFELDLAHIQARDGLQLKQIRLILEDSENYIEMSDGSRCDLQTPSQQQSGLKVIMPGGVTVNSQLQYQLKLALDLQKSLVFTGQGKCILKPVIKLGSIQQVIIVDTAPTTTLPTTTTTTTSSPPTTLAPPTTVEPTTTIEPTTTTVAVTTTTQDPTSVCDNLTDTIIDPITGGSDFWVCF